MLAKINRYGMVLALVVFAGWFAWDIGGAGNSIMRAAECVELPATHPIYTIATIHVETRLGDTDGSVLSDNTGTSYPTAWQRHENTKTKAYAQTLGCTLSPAQQVAPDDTHPY